MADPKNIEHEDDDDDEEYVDAMDERSDGGGDEPTKEDEQHRPRLSVQKRKAVDQAFEEMFGYPYGTTFAPLNKRRRRNKKERILVEIFGPTAAARLLGSTAASAAATTIKTKLVLPQKKTVTQVRRFAGTNVMIQTTVEDKPSSSSKPPKKPATGLDLVLDQLEDNKISTVAKTSMDWDKFKGDRGLEEELEKKAQGKDAYLVKKDFLDRVDHRRFEHERTERDKERASKQK